MSIERQNRLRRSLRRYLRIESLEGRRVLATYVVNTTADISNGEDEFFSFREAIAAANDNGGPDDITFEIPDSDEGYNPLDNSWRIQPTSELPTITDPVNIWGQNGSFGPTFIQPQSYSGPNGYSEIVGDQLRTYWDESYSTAFGPGATEDGNSLVGGLGDLTDGFIPIGGSSVAELEVAGPYVGWNINPVITFSFVEETQFEVVRIYYDGLFAPESVNINGLVFNFGGPFAEANVFSEFDISSLGPTSELTIQFTRPVDVEWIFVSEIEFLENVGSGGVVELNGQLAGSDVNGLYLSSGSDGSIVNGLVINGFSGAGIRIESSDNIISDNFIGTDVSGTTANGNRNGIEIVAPNSEVTANNNLIVGNLLSGNGGVEYAVSAQAEPWDWDVDPETPLSNELFQFGVQDGLPATLVELESLGASAGDTISVRYRRGLTDAFNLEPSVDGNGYVGSEFKNDQLGSSGLLFPSAYVDESEYDVFLNALIGVFTDDEGNIVGDPMAIKNGRDLEVPVGATRLQLGINDDVFVLNQGALTVVVSGPRFGSGDPNNGNGVLISGFGSASGNEVVNNLIGTDVSGTYAVGNTHDGVAIFNSGATGNFVGGPHSESLEQFSRNVIAGNGAHGVDIAFGASGNFVQGNFIGLSEINNGESTNSLAIPNGGVGVLINFASNGNFIGTDLDDLDDEIEGNVISGNSQAGVYITEGSELNLVAGNLIGTDVQGINPIANQWGILIFGGNENTIGSGLLAGRNIISGNIQEGIGIYGVDATSNQILGNTIGTDRFGLVAVPNGAGIIIGEGASDNDVGTNVEDGNLISGNLNEGILIRGATTQNNRVAGNVIGTNFDGDDLGNVYGVSIVGGAHHNTIGGVSTIHRNVISGSQFGGVEFVSGATANQVLNNLIGTDVSGSFPVPNDDVGVRLNGAVDETSDNLIASNVIAGNNIGIILFGEMVFSNRIEGNFVGTNRDGDANVPNLKDGIQILAGANGNTVGGLAIGEAGTAPGNVISGNGGNGIFVEDADSTTINGNLIGLFGGLFSNSLPNQKNGIQVRNSTNTQIGGIASNFISSNAENGIHILNTVPVEGTATTVLGNFIGTGGLGTESNLGNSGDGIEVENSSGNLINSNVISANLGNGIFLNGLDTFGNTIVRNLIGTGPDRNDANGNGLNGIELQSAHDNTIGGEVTSPGFQLGNVIVDNGLNGISIQNSFSSDETEGVINNIIQGNLIGISRQNSTSASIPLGNTLHGIYVADSRHMLIGGNSASTRNVISSNGLDGVHLVDFNTPSSFNTVQENYIGTDHTGLIDLGNGDDGVEINNTDRNVIASNLISGNGSGENSGANGVQIVGFQSFENTVTENKIGTDVSGNKSLANTGNGVFVHSGGIANEITDNSISGNGLNGIHILATNEVVVSGNIIGTNAGGTAAISNGANGVFVEDSSFSRVAGNLISGNSDNGILILDALASENSHTDVLDNQIGTNSSGLAAIPNGLNGVEVASSDNNTISGNLISGNLQNGIYIHGAGADANSVTSNMIGTNVDGEAAIPNSRNGIFLLGDAVDNVIGGLTPVPGTEVGNLISGNGQAGIVIDHVVAEMFPTNASILGNAIGVSSTGSPLGNGSSGVVIKNGASRNTVGGTASGAANIIAHNAADGVSVGDGTTDPAIGNAIRGNSIYLNGEQGIDLGSNGPTANDLGDPDGGPNQRQNTPLITAAIASADGTTIYFSLNSVASATFDIEFFDNPSNDDEGRVFLQAFPVTTNATGNFASSLTVPGNLAGRKITATATQTSGLNRNTSEFSLAVVPNVDVTQRISVRQSGFTPVGSNFNQTLTIRNISSTSISGDIYLLIDGIAPSNTTFTAFFGTTALPVLNSAGGSKYIKLPIGALNELAAGASLNIRLRFSVKPTGYTMKFLSGTGPV